ncbi:cobalt ABC transporter permease [Cohaesibacter celericrescens]|uniref:Cobalt ABC transporter permease n=1 Tax=Cohaesibacter celericrescens TaxID=2067669 RepID=A0A2N5XVY2_9HYPH|nr:cobalt ABC transporter permease [Cohaesibacter celericrescens]PLW78627.1 cobalt ABC transporter permease [Cohaesibacter celericrescens]
MNKSIAAIFSGLLLLVGLSLPAYAHKVIVSAYAEGALIEGEIGFSGGDASANTIVDVLDDAGNKIGETKTNEDGIFQFTPTQHIPHTFRANLGQGHIAIYRLDIDELPEGLATKDAKGPVEEGIKEPVRAPATRANENPVSLDQEALQEIIRNSVKAELAAFQPEIASAIRKETKPVWKEIAAYKEKNDFQTILGGIGYILGLFGVGFYFAARRERKKAEAGSNPAKGNTE